MRGLLLDGGGNHPDLLINTAVSLINVAASAGITDFAGAFYVMAYMVIVAVLIAKIPATTS